MTQIPPLTNLQSVRFDRPDILKRLTAASRQLAELKGVAASRGRHALLNQVKPISYVKANADQIYFVSCVPSTPTSTRRSGSRHAISALVFLLP